jgi:hypothetical protein
LKSTQINPEDISALKEKDALRWAQFAMPSSNPKQKRVKDWLAAQANDN